MNSELLYWEDFPVGESVTLGAKSVTAEMIVAFARAYDPQPIHLDEEAAKRSLLGGLSASGWQSCALMMRMLCDGFLLRAASMGAPGVEEIRWMKPLKPGDTIALVRTTLDRRTSKSKPALGLTQFRIELFNQRHERTMTGQYWQLLARRNPGA
jgi:acyl dehydratase